MKTAFNPVCGAAGLLAAALLAGCGSLSPGGAAGRAPMEQAIAPADKVAMLPIANFTDVPQAGLRAEALLESALRQAGLRQLVVYPPALNPETLFEPGERKAQAEAEKWARAQGMRYTISGAVNEWRYKVGVDGEPAVGLMLQVRDLKTDQVVYSTAGGRTGWSREALAAVGQKLTAELVSGIRIEPAASLPAASR
ncbi:penicillin-binding protein activator LpoB [Variovorax terrae]|uniref:Penicillin-binding protein activator LpoB n=1 Tax=Variovorax terrae TaxID=2923278 RepID=A0A9X1VYW6_9BURK|nr:penicillin-binding protein activator LpoB [Variovorax terrae]MCJ0765429.1 penicillin-binding protein activator LpoB [Variovorax terrae]